MVISSTATPPAVLLVLPNTCNTMQPERMANTDYPLVYGYDYIRRDAYIY
jgi:hypothetical protein